VFGVQKVVFQRNNEYRLTNDDLRRRVPLRNSAFVNRYSVFSKALAVSLGWSQLPYITNITLPANPRIEIRGYRVGRAYGTLKWGLGRLLAIGLAIGSINNEY